MAAAVVTPSVAIGHHTAVYFRIKYEKEVRAVCSYVNSTARERMHVHE